MRKTPRPAPCPRDRRPGRLLCLVLPLICAACATPPPCAATGSWAAPGTLRRQADPIPQARPVTLLGEEHDSAADHAWELATIRRAHAAHPDLILGFEMFPRSVQPALDAWVQGRLSEARFLAQSGWHDFWGFDPGLYMPIFRYARDHHIPMIGLNVSHRLVHLVARSGWGAVPPDAREGVGTPAPPSAAYRAELAAAMAGHGGPAMTPDRLQHFIDAQSVWDRAMAEAIAAARIRYPGRPILAIMGAGHLENRNGVPHQLAALGITAATVLLPVHDACTPPGAGYADAVFVD